MDLARRVSGKDAVLGKRRIANHAVQAHLAASGGGHTELSAGEGLAGGAVPLLDDQRALGLVLKVRLTVRPSLIWMVCDWVSMR